MGLRIWMSELLNEKYRQPFDISRVTLYLTRLWLKLYPLDALLVRYEPLQLCESKKEIVQS